MTNSAERELPEITLDELEKQATAYANERMAYLKGKSSLAFYKTEDRLRDALMEGFCQFAAGRYSIVPPQSDRANFATAQKLEPR